MKIIIILVLLVLSTFAINLKKANYEHRVEWEAANGAQQDCWWRCTEAGGFSCAFGDEGRKTSKYYICVDTQEQCTEWLNNYYICPVAHCIPWRYSNTHRKVIYC